MENSQGGNFASFGVCKLNLKRKYENSPPKMQQMEAFGNTQVQALTAQMANNANTKVNYDAMHPYSETMTEESLKSIKLEDVKKALRIRNISDTTRKNSPLLKHRDSVEIDTGKLDKSAMLAKMSKYVERVLKKKYVK